MPRPYSPGNGLIHTDRLTQEDIGNVVKTVDNSLNGALVQYNADPRTHDGKPSIADLEALAAYFNVGWETVNRWFGIGDEPGDGANRNCVSLKEEGWRYCRMTDYDARARITLAACLAFAGGLQRDPIITRGDKEGNPYLHSEHFANLAQAVEYVMTFYDDDEDDMTNHGWVQITIEPRTSGPGWDVNILHFYPKSGEDYHYDDADNAPDDDPAEDDNDD